MSTSPMVTTGALILTAASPVRVIVGEVSEIEPGVMRIVLTPKQTLSVIPCVAFTVWLPMSIWIV